MKFLVNFTLLKYIKSQRSYGFFNHKRADFWLPNFGLKRSLLSFLKSQKDGGCLKCLFLNNENYDVCLPPYLSINKTQFDKKKTDTRF